MAGEDYDDPSTSREFMAKQIYYHGLITRISSEQLLKTDGQFLIRDSISKPGDYVLTSFWRGRALHFQVNKTKQASGRMMYHFEDEQFISVPQLISFYIAHRRPITLASGCIINTPMAAAGVGAQNENHAKELEAAYAQVFNPHSQNAAHPRSLTQQAILNQALRRGPRPQSAYSMERSVQSYVPALPSSLVNRPLPVPIRSPRQSKEEQDDYCEMDYDAMDNILDASSMKLASSTLSLRDRSSSSMSLSAVSISRSFNSCQNLSGRIAAPPLPPRPKLPSNRDSAIILDTSDYDEPKAKDSQENTSKALSSSDYDHVKSKSQDLDCAGAKMRKDSADYDDITSRLRDSGISMSGGKQDLETSSFLLETFSHFLGTHSVDELCDFICNEDVKILKFIGTGQRPQFGAENGLRIILLPQGEKMREDLMQRSRSLQLIVVISILRCRAESSKIVRQWVLIANSLLNQHGNFFGFVNILQGLTSKLLSDQDWIWKQLDLHTRSEFDVACNHFSKLRQTGEPPKCAAPCLIPILHPVLELFANNSTGFKDDSSFSAEIDSLWRWLEMARAWTLVADDMRERSRKRYGTVRPGPDCPLSQSSLARLLCDTTNLPEKRFSPALATIERLLQCN